MTKLIVFLSIAALALLMVGTVFYPNFYVFWLASSSMKYQYLRAILSTILLIQLMGESYLHRLTRFIFGLAGIGFMAWVIFSSIYGQMALLDGLSLLAAAVAFEIEVLESSVKENYIRIFDRLRQRNSEPAEIKQGKEWLKHA